MEKIFILKKNDSCYEVNIYSSQDHFDFSGKKILASEIGMEAGCCR